jgi:hypothetical protein
MKQIFVLLITLSIPISTLAVVPEVDFLEACTKFGGTVYPRGTVYQNKYCFKQGGFNMCYEKNDTVCDKVKASYKDSAIKFCKDLGGKVVSTPVSFKLPSYIWLDSNCDKYSCEILSENGKINESPYMRYLNYPSVLCEKVDTSAKTHNGKKN